MIIHGDCIEELKKLPDNSVHAIITDPPYELGFMGKSWDSTGIANNVELWQEAERVLTPGGHLIAFSGTRTYHRMASAIEDAGFEIRDMIEWVYGSGFPKSLNIGKAVDKLQGNERENIGIDENFLKRNPNKLQYLESINNGFKDGKDAAIRTKGTSEWEGFGTALKPAHEPIVVARKKLSEKSIAENCLKWGTGGINIDECRVGTGEDKGIWPITKRRHNDVAYTVQPVETDKTIGRFPANLIHDGSDEVIECFPESNGRYGAVNTGKVKFAPADYGNGQNDTGGTKDSGSAARFFKSIIYQAKASKSERNEGCEELEEKRSSAYGYEKGFGNAGEGMFKDRNPIKHNNHPTVKPLKLMEYLITMFSREGQTVLDPFGGSGTTGLACKNLNRDYILIEREPDYIEIIKHRLND